MSVIINPQSLSGTITAPPSKSMTHRYLVISALANGTSLLETPLRSDDTLATIDAIRKLNIYVEDIGNEWEIAGGSPKASTSVIDCKESGTTMRLMLGFCSLLNEASTLTGAPSLIRRPNKPLLEALEQLGVMTQSKDGYPPITVKGKMNGGKASIRGDVSSQFVSSIILAAPYAKHPVDLKVTTQLESKPYVEMTIDAMKKSGITAQYTDSLDKIHIPLGNYIPQIKRIEGDWSSAAYMLAAGAISGKVHVDNLDIESKQADKEIIQILKQMGAYMKFTGNRVTTEKSDLKAIDIDLRDCPDLFPIVSCLCSIAEGRSTLTGLGRLKIKESDRLEAVIEGLERMGVKMIRSENSLTIIGDSPIGAMIDPHNDHRIAMSFAILAQRASGKTKILNSKCVSKSYPEFWGHLKKIGAKIR